VGATNIIFCLWGTTKGTTDTKSDVR
jgi:hypothetical protein